MLTTDSGYVDHLELAVLYLFYNCRSCCKIKPFISFSKDSPFNSYSVSGINDAIKNVRDELSPITSYQLATGSCELMIVDFLLCRSSMISSNIIRGYSIQWCQTKIIEISRSYFSILLISRT